MYFRGILTTCGLLVACVGTIASADVVVEQKTTITPVVQPGSTATAKPIVRSEKVSIHEDAMRIDDRTRQRSLIIDLEEMKALLIDNKTKTVTEIVFPMAGKLAQEEKSLKLQIKQL